MAYLGEMDEAGRLGMKDAAEGPKQREQGRLFAEAARRRVEVDLDRVGVENGRAFGGMWLGMQLIERLELPELLGRLIEPGREQVPCGDDGVGAGVVPVVRSLQ